MFYQILRETENNLNIILLLKYLDNYVFMCIKFY